jgi:hypothetical protein
MTRTTPAVLRELLGDSFEPVQVVAMVFAGVGLAAATTVGLDGLATWRVALGAALIGDIGAGCLSNFTASTNGFYAARPMLRWVFIAAHVHLLVVAWALEWPLAPAFAIWAWTIASASVVNLLAGRAEQRLVAGGLFAASLLAPLVFTMLASMQVVSALFTLKVAYAFAVRHEAGLSSYRPPLR